MTNFEQALTDGWAANLSDNGPFAESVVITKHNGGATRTVYASVTRDPPERVGKDGKVFRPAMLILVQNSTTTGYASSELDARDTVTLAYRINGTTKAYPIRLAETEGNQDAATLLLKVD